MTGNDSHCLSLSHCHCHSSILDPSIISNCSTVFFKILARLFYIRLVTVIKISLCSSSSKVVLFTRSDFISTKFSLSGPICESSYVEQVLIDYFGSLVISPPDLFSFLETNHLITKFFDSPQLEVGTLQPSALDPPFNLRHSK